MEQKQLQKGKWHSTLIYCRSEDNKEGEWMFCLNNGVCAQKSVLKESACKICSETHGTIIPYCKKWKHILSMVFCGRVWAVLSRDLDND